MNTTVKVLCFVLLAVTSGACSTGRPSAADDTTLTILYPETGIRAFLDQEGPFVFLLPLVGLTETGEMEGRLAQRWEHTPDRRDWTIWLRSNVRWHDGVPVTAHDIAFTVDLEHHPALGRSRHIENVTVIDDTTFTMRFAPLDPYAAWWLPGAWDLYYPKHLLEHEDPATFDQWAYWEQPIGNGPFRWVRHVPGTLIEFEANPDYYRGEPSIKRLIVRFGALGFTELLAGEVDAVNFASRREAATLADDPRFRIYREVWDDISALQCIFWNHANPMFQDARVRRAFTLAIDREELKFANFMWPGLPIIDGLVSPRQYWNEQFPPPFPFDPEEARRLLDQAGWHDTDGDGVRERDGQPLEFTTILNAEWEGAGVYASENLARVGVRMRLLLLDNSVVRERFADGDFDAAIVYLSANPGPWPRSLDAILGDASTIGYRNTRVMELLSALRTTMSYDSVDALYGELSDIIRRDVPFTYLTQNVETYVANARVRGLSTPFRANPLWNAEFLWLED